MKAKASVKSFSLAPSKTPVLPLDLLMTVMLSALSILIVTRLLLYIVSRKSVTSDADFPKG